MTLDPKDFTLEQMELLARGARKFARRPAYRPRNETERLAMEGLRAQDRRREELRLENEAEQN